MGYRGEDASRTRTDSRRQPPWQSSSGTGPGAAWSGSGGPGDYDQQDEHAAADGYGYSRDDSYAGHEGSGYQGYEPDAQYGQPGEYGQQADDGYRDDYGPGYGPGPGYGGYRDAPAGGGYDRAGGYPALPSGDAQPGNYAALPSGPGRSGNYPALPSGPARSGGYPALPSGPARSGDYPALPSGPARSGDYPVQPGGYGQSGDYPVQPGGQHARPGGYGHTGDFPALGTGPDNGQVDLPGNYAGNDWYGQPGTASGSGFADTGTYTMDARTIDSYGSGPQAAQPVPEPSGLPYTGQQERYDGDYEAYVRLKEQTGLGDRAGYGGDGGYEAPQGYDQYDDYDQYDQQAGFGAGGYAPAAGGYAPGDGDFPDSYDDYADHDDPYQERFGDDGKAPRSGGRQRKQAKPGKNTPGTSKPGGKRGKRPLLLSAFAVVAVIVLGAAAYTFVFKPKPTASNSTATPGPLPTSGASSAATAACVKQFGQYCHIEQRTDDPTPLTLDELFPPQFLNETDHNSFTRVATKLDKTCANAVIGQDLISALQSGKCTQVLRASYLSGDNKIMGTIGVVNLGTTNEAHHGGKVIGANDFIAPLSTTKGIASKLGKGTGVVEAEFKGHYLILTWAEFTSTKAPATKAQNQQLEAFENDLVAGTANISLSQRMVNGVPATAAG
jgi:hypothetical protein